jgi:hypothetical protein
MSKKVSLGELNKLRTQILLEVVLLNRDKRIDDFIVTTE